MNLDEIQRRTREIFRLEAADLLQELEAALLELEGDPAATATIDRVFRVMHTLKGSGATSGFQDLSDFLHHVEEVFTAAREQRLQVNSEMIGLTLRLADVVSRYLAAPPADASGVLDAARDDLAALLAHLPKKEPAGGDAAPQAASQQPNTFHILFRPGPQIFRSGFDPGMFLDDLRALGPCVVHGFTNRLPPLATLDPEDCHLRWEIDLTTARSEDDVRGVFMFIEDACDLEIHRVAATPAAAGGSTAVPRTWYIEFRTTARTLAAPGALDALWRDLARLGRHRILASPPPVDGHIPPGTWQVALETNAEADAIGGTFVFLADAAPRLQSEPFASAAGPAPGAVAAPPAFAAPPAAKASAPAGAETLRVSAERIDRLVNLVGELVILRSQVSNICATLPSLPPALQGAEEALQRLTKEMRDVVLNIRMMPIEQTFMKFRRIVRDLSHNLGKDVELVVEGGETEMDKTVLDQLGDPLVHLVRNSLDHGLEPPEVRTAAGKPARGVLRLRAAQRGDRVVVSVSDDGRGLDPARIRAKAVQRGLLAADARPSDAELFQLIFLPGFSTAETVSQVSGRGVGLDVVRRQIDQLRGKVEVHSELGRGAEFRLSLPLTMAIIEGLMVEVDGAIYILPLGLARETIELTRAQRTAGNGRNVVSLRGGLVPYVRLRDLFGATAEPPDLERIVIAEIEDQRLGVVVDRVLGNHQTVLKSLGWIGRRVNVFSGATVLGDGRVALILDLPALLAHHHRRRGAASGLEI